MYVSCSHCSTSLDVAPEHAGHTVQCPACGGRLQIPQADSSGTAPGGKPQREGWAEADHANVHLGMSFLIGVGITALFLLLMVPLKSMRVGEIFLSRGWVPFAEAFLFFWGLTILFLKWRQNQRQERAALINLFPEQLGRTIDVSTVGAFIANVYSVPLALRDSIIVNRIRKSLELFESRVDNSEVGTFLNSQSDLDANRSSGSYILLKVFLWAIPILGFIGTVMGLSTAVGALDMSKAADQEAMKASLQGLTSGLGVAFDTTLLGLILSILMSFPMAAVQKQEEETLTIIDAFCTEKLLPRLDDSKSPTTDGLLEQAESIPQLVASLARAHETFLVNLNASTQSLQQSSDTLQNRLEMHQHTVEQSFTESMEKLNDTSSEVFLRAHKELNQTFERIAVGIDLINKSLGDLGGKKIPTRKKGFFRRS